MAKKKNPCKFILIKSGEELNFDQARDFLFKNYDFNTKTLKSESYAIQVEEPGQVPVQPEARVGEKMAEGAPQAKPEVTAEKGKVEEKTIKEQVLKGIPKEEQIELSFELKAVNDAAENESISVNIQQKDNTEQEPVIANIESKAKSSSKSELTESIREADEIINAVSNVRLAPVSSLNVDESRFQNRMGANGKPLKVSDMINNKEMAGDSFDRVDEISKNWSDADQDPVHIWRDPSNGKYYVLSGHHRYAAAIKSGRNNIKIIDRTNDFTEKQAIKFATEDANANRAMETSLERAKALRKKRDEGASREEINKFVEREGKNKIFVNNISFLSPNGKMIETLERFSNAEDRKTQKEIEQRADWIGEARRMIPGLTDVHEQEMFDFLFNKKQSARITQKSDFITKVRASFKPLMVNEPLNLARFKVITQGESAFEEEVSQRKSEIQDLQKQVDDIKDRFVNPRNPDYIPSTSPDYKQVKNRADEKIANLNTEIKARQKSLESFYREKNKYLGAPTVGTLFDVGMEMATEEAPSEKPITPTEYEKATKEPAMLEGVRDGRPEEKGREVSPELRAEEEAKREEEVKIDQEKAKTIEAGKKLADKIRGLKIKTPGAQINIAGIPAALYNTAIETIATAIETGATLKAAIDSAIKKHNLNKQKDFNRDEFIKSLEDATELKYEEELEVIAKSGEERIESEKKAAKETVKAQKKAAEEVKTKLTADADSGDMIDRLFKKVGEKTEKKMPPNVMQPISKTKESVFPKEVQQRMDEARVKPQQENWFTKAVARLRNFGLGFSRMYVELDPKKYGQVIDILRTLKNADQRAKELAERHMQNILGDLDNNQKAIFQDYVIASDMLGSIEDGLYETDLEWSDRSGPFGFESFQEVRDAVAKLEQKLNEDPKIKEAVDRRNEFINAMWNTSKKAGLVSGEQVGSGRSYFHRQVLKFQEENNASAAILKSSARRKKLSQFKKRKGSTMDYYTNFPEVEAGVVMSTAFEIIKRQEINSIEQIYKPIYDKFKTEASEKAQKAIDQVKSEFGEDSKEYQTALDNQKDLEDKFLLDLMGDEYTIYFPDGKNSLFKTEVITGDAAEKAIEMITDGYVESGIDNLTDGIKPAIMMMKGRRMFIPNDVANVFDRLGAAKAGQEPAIELFKDFVSGSTKIFKKMALLSPFRIIKYVYGNFAGDADKIAATDRRIVARVPDAIRMIVDARKNNKYDPIYDLAIKYGVIGSGSKIEIGDVSAADWSKFAMDKKADIQDLVRKAMENMGGIKWSVEKYFDIVGGIASTREDVFRLAAFIRALEKTKKGEQFYWFSRKTEVDQITNPERKAAKIAREIFGDYGAISQNGEFMAKYLMPFYRFRETNIRAYKNFIFNNFDTKEGKEQILKYGVAKGVTKVATKAAIYSAQMALFTAAVYAWNKIMFPDEEDELRSGGDQSFHIILGRRADGSVRVLRTQGTLNAFMESLGLTGIIQLYKDYENKDVTMADVAKEPSKAFANEFYQGLTPYIKIPFELASGKSRFPNLFRPRTIRDNTEYLFSAMSLRLPYEMLSGKPTLKKDYADLFLTSSMNPKEIAYYQAVNKINEDIGSLGLSVIPGGSILAKTKEQKSEALWRYKMNVKFGNTEEAEKDLIKYYQLGGTPQTLKQTVKALNPIGNYSKFMQSYIQNRIKGAEIDFSKTQKVGEKVKIFIKNRRYIVAPEEIEYAKSISKKDIKMFDMAIKYYEETYKKKK